MIVINDDKTKVLYVRTNRRVKWKYAEYGGRHETIEAAIKSATEHFNGQGFEYLIEDLCTDETSTGFVNWK